MTEQNQAPSPHERRTQATVLVVTPDLTLLKLLSMALKLELDCEVLGFTSSRNAEATMRSISPDLVILDEQFFDGQMQSLADHLHRTQIPTLFLNAQQAARNPENATISLDSPWKVEVFYAAVHHLLGHTP